MNGILSSALFQCIALLGINNYWFCSTLKVFFRKAEADHVAGFAKEQGEGAQWDEIAKLCEAKAQKGGKDVSRLKSLLLHLKEQNSKKLVLS